MELKKNYKFWFATGSQDLYGDECLSHVAKHAQIIVQNFNESGILPFEVVWKPTLIDSTSIRRTFEEANADEECAGVITWMHTFSPAKSWIAGLQAFKGDVNIAVLQGTIGSSAEIGRTKGFKEGIKDQKNFKIIASQTGEFTQAKGQEVMESFLKQNKDIDVVVAQNDNMAFGAIDALKAAGKTPGKDVTIISFDAIKAALKKVQSGEINAEFECNPLHGPRVAELAKKIMKGEKVDKIQYVDEQVFTKDNTTKEVINKRAY